MKWRDREWRFESAVWRLDFGAALNAAFYPSTLYSLFSTPSARFTLPPAEFQIHTPAFRLELLR